MWIANTFILLLFLVPICVGQAPLEDIKHEIIKNQFTPEPIANRIIFVSIDLPTFDRERDVKRLAKLFRSIQADYCFPEILTIYAYSDVEQLKKQISFENLPVFIDFANTLEGEIAAEKYYDKVGPKRKGYFRSSYDRNLKFEQFLYSPDINGLENARFDFDKPEGTSLASDLTSVCRESKPKE